MAPFQPPLQERCPQGRSVDNFELNNLILNRKGFLGQQLSERDESSIFLNSAYSEFCCPKLFWVLLQSKVPERIGMSYHLDPESSSESLNL